jgi:hypothetical protein
MKISKDVDLSRLSLDLLEENENESFSKKLQKTFARNEKEFYFCTRF